MRVLIACEESQVVCKAFRLKGHKAFSCDLLDCSGGHPEWHFKGDLREYLDEDWDLIIAHPPCTRLCNSGVRWLHERGLWREMEESARFFKMILDYKRCNRVAIENPIMHKYAIEIIGRRQDQIIQPWQFGHGETKATCLWLRNLPKLKPTNVVEGREARIHMMPPSEERSKVRSKTFSGVAKAMAEQWGI